MECYYEINKFKISSTYSAHVHSSTCVLIKWFNNIRYIYLFDSSTGTPASDVRKPRTLFPNNRPIITVQDFQGDICNAPPPLPLWHFGLGYHDQNWTWKPRFQTPRWATISSKTCGWLYSNQKLETSYVSCTSMITTSDI